MWVGRTFNEGLMSSFYRFLARFSGRRRGLVMRLGRMRLPLLPLFSLLALQTLTPVVEGCSSRSTPKPRPTLSTSRPNVTFHTFACPPEYEAWFCLNGATCFTVQVGESTLYNCECADGYMGQRCEFKDLEGSYLPARKKMLLETASIASGVFVAIFLAVIFIFVYIHYQRKQKYNSATCEVDGGGDIERRAPFSSRRETSRYPLRTYPPNTISPQAMGDITSVYAEQPP